jgi:hypothetical protein
LLTLAIPASASVATYPVMNTSEQPPDGVWFRNSPHQNDTNRETGFGVYMGESVAVDCWASGDTVGPYGNTIWYRGLDVTRPAVNGHANYGYMNTHYINDGMNANQHASGIPNCSDPAPAPSPTPAPPPAPKYCFLPLRINTANITWFYQGNHRYLGNARAAAQAWNNSGVGIHFTEVSSRSKAILTLVDYSNGKDGSLAYTALGGNVVGGTGSTTPTRALVATATVYVNRAMMEKFPVPARNNVRDSAVTHEFGHVLGLHHPELCGRDGTGTLMRAGGPWVLQPTSTFYTAPQSDDVTGVRLAFSY